MAYSELIKNFNKIREYMRQFYVYGFKSRSDYDGKSARSYDNERRRIESWLGEYMSFRQEPAGKIAFLSVDTQQISRNPLYSAWKAKSFTSNDITLHFYILDLLKDEEMTAGEVTEQISERYLSAFDDPVEFDLSTVRNKLKEYEQLGLLESRKEGRKQLYSITDYVSDESWTDALAFFSEADPMGVIGSFILDRPQYDFPDYYSFKHHYILHALESEILCRLLEAISDDRSAEITVHTSRSRSNTRHLVIPLRILVSTQTGRSYVLAHENRQFQIYRLDNIEEVVIGDVAECKAQLLRRSREFVKRLWGVSTNSRREAEHLEMVLFVETGAEYIVQRLQREKRHGIVEELEDGCYRFSIDVYDATEMIPWLRTFIGRIIKMECTNDHVTKTFYRDMDAMYEMYGMGGEPDAVS